MSSFIRTGAVALAIAAGALSAGSASATSLEIIVENTAEVGGFAFTPLYFAFQDGSFDAFDVGAEASAGVELLAELGNPSTLAGERTAVATNSQGGSIPGAAGVPGPLDPGESASTTIDVNGAENRYFMFLSMILPSNDTFFGTENPLAYELFDDLGNFVGETVIQVTGAFLYDAGTEVNDPNDGPPFVAGGNPQGGTEENGLVQLATSLADFAGVQTPLGPLNGDLIDFTSDPANFAVATITIREAVAPVPVPAAALIMLSGLGALGGLRAVRKRA